MTPNPSTHGQLRTHVFIAPMREFGSEGKHWSPCASTLVTGEADAVLTDTGHIKSDVSALGDMIEQTGKRLTTIYITHGHLDHFLGTAQLVDRFPGARPVATAAVVADIKSSVAEQEQQWQTRFGDDVDKTAVIPEPLEGNVIDLEGHELRVIEVAQGDISPSTVIHIPSIDTVIGGDVVYNRIHMMLALTGPVEWQKWIESIDLVEGLGATTIIAGHKQPDASATRRVISEARASTLDNSCYVNLDGEPHQTSSDRWTRSLPRAKQARTRRPPRQPKASTMRSRRLRGRARHSVVRRRRMRAADG